MNAIAPLMTSREERPYHHGDLASALVDAGLDALDRQPAEAISLRALARSIGVSATAAYRHFPNKTALTSAIAQRGLAELTEAQRKASVNAGGGAAGLGATGAAYVNFALERPALFRLIFNHVPPPGAAASSEAMAMLLAAAGETAPPDTLAVTYALRCWSIAHGLSMLMLDEFITPDAGTIDLVVGKFPLAPSAK